MLYPITAYLSLLDDAGKKNSQACRAEPADQVTRAGLPNQLIRIII